MRLDRVPVVLTLLVLSAMASPVTPEAGSASGPSRPAQGSARGPHLEVRAAG